VQSIRPEHPCFIFPVSPVCAMAGLGLGFPATAVRRRCFPALFPDSASSRLRTRVELDPVGRRWQELCEPPFPTSPVRGLLLRDVPGLVKLSPSPIQAGARGSISSPSAPDDRISVGRNSREQPPPRSRVELDLAGNCRHAP
jgi:hypothetical protein